VLVEDHFQIQDYTRAYSSGSRLFFNPVNAREECHFSPRRLNIPYIQISTCTRACACNSKPKYSITARYYRVFRKNASLCKLFEQTDFLSCWKHTRSRVRLIANLNHVIKELCTAICVIIFRRQLVRQWIRYLSMYGKDFHSDWKAACAAARVRVFFRVFTGMLNRRLPRPPCIV